jgi:hypothetical protein
MELSWGLVTLEIRHETVNLAGFEMLSLIVL